MRTIKILLSIIVIFISVIIAAPFFLDPNDFKDEISAAVEKSTGRKLEISGNLSLSIFPWLGVSTEKLTLGNRKGFKEGPFATIKSAQIRVELLPLLRSEVKMDSLVLSGLNLQLERRKNGKDNWSDLAGNSQTQKKPDTSSTDVHKLAALAIGGIIVDDANIRFRDAQTNQDIKLSDLSLKTGKLELGAPTDIQLKTKLAAQQPEIKGSLSLDTQLQANPFAGTYQLNDSRISVDLRGKDLPAGKLTATLAANIAANLITQTLDLSGLNFVSEPLAVKGNMSLTKIFANSPSVSGKIKVAAFSPRKLFKKLNIAIPSTADAKALTQAAFDTNISGNLNKIKLTQLKLILDDSLIEGQITLINNKTTNIQYALNLDRIDLDRYLPPPTTQTSSFGIIPTAIAAAKSKPLFPVDLLRSFDMSGDIKAGQLIMNRLQIYNISARIKQQQGDLKIEPIEGNAYGGKYLGHIRIDARRANGNSPLISVDESLTNVNINPVIKIITGKDALSGTGNVSAVLTTRGQSINVLKKSLNGEVKISLTNGALKGIDVVKIIRDTYAQYKNKKTDTGDGLQETPFTNMNVSFQVRNGIMNSQDLVIQSALPLVRGKGSINIINNTLNYTIKTSANKELVELVGMDKSLIGVPLRINVNGNLENPSYNIDWLRIVGRVLEKTQKKKLLDSLLGKKKKKSTSPTPVAPTAAPKIETRPETREERKKRKKREKKEKIKNLLKGLF